MLIHPHFERFPTNILNAKGIIPGAADNSITYSTELIHDVQSMRYIPLLQSEPDQETINGTDCEQGGAAIVAPRFTGNGVRAQGTHPLKGYINGSQKRLVTQNQLRQGTTIFRGTVSQRIYRYPLLRMPCRNAR